MSAQRRPPRSQRVRGQDLPEEPTTRRILGTVAVVGYPNVGKSTLINRLTQTRETVVHAQPGVTRDRKELLVEWSGEAFRVVDTGGVDAGDPSEMQRQVAEQARAAISEADVVAFVIDARAGIGAGDEELADLLRRSRKPVLVGANNPDAPRHDVAALELHALGLGDPIPVSGLHGTGTGD